MVAGLDDAGMEPEAVAVVGCEQLELLDVEPEVVQAVEPFVQPVALVGAEELVADELVPELLVAVHERGGGLLARRLERPARLGGHVLELAGEVLLCDLQVMLTLAIREGLVQLARLRVHEVRRERAGVAAEERVRKRAVPPEEPREVEAHEQLCAGVEQPVAEVGPPGAREERAKGERVVEVPGDENGFERVVDAGGDADRLDDGHLGRSRGRGAARTRAARRRPAAP